LPGPQFINESIKGRHQASRAHCKAYRNTAADLKPSQSSYPISNFHFAPKSPPKLSSLVSITLGHRIQLKPQTPFGVNEAGWIVGWSGNSISNPVRAVLRFAATDQGIDWIDLNDSHFISGTSGWVLINATAINDAGQIVGVGTLYGSQRAFILAPRTSGN